MKDRTCYLMIRDVPGQGSETVTAIEWGVDWGLLEGETLPEDHEQLSDAQFTTFQIMQTLKGVMLGMGAEVIKGNAPSGLVVPEGKQD